MTTIQEKLNRLSETADDLPDFLEQASKLLEISFRRMSMEAGLSPGTVWGLVSSTRKRGGEETLAKLALYLKVPEVNLRSLAGYGPRRILPEYDLGEAQAIFDAMTPEERERWVGLGELILKARGKESSSAPGKPS